MTTGTLGVAIIGCGFMGGIHAARWANAPGARVVAVCDVDAARAVALAATCGLDAHHTDYRAAIDRPDVQAVSICVPTFMHPEVAIFAAGRGKHLLCEKPIALTLEAADAMLAAAAQAGVCFSVGFMRRHSPVTAALRDWIGAGGLGRPLLALASDIRELRPKRLMHDADGNGGPVIDMAVHLFDQWAALFGAPAVEVSAVAHTLAAARPEIAHIARKAVDTATITVRYASGDAGTFVVSWGLPPGVNGTPRPDQIYGPNGLVEAVFTMPYQEAARMLEGGARDLFCVSNDDMYQLEINQFAAAVRGDAPLAVPAAAGRAALAVAHAALESIRTGQPARPAAV